MNTYVFKSDNLFYPSSISIDENNDISKILSDCFYKLGYDEKNFKKNTWNPLGDNLIKPNDIVLIKPNMVMDKNQKEEFGTDCLFTNVAVIDAIIPFIIKALNNKGRIIVADAPMQDCNWNNFLKISGYEQLLEKYKKYKLEIRDLRNLISDNKKQIKKQIISENEKNIIIDLGNKSLFSSLSEKQINNLRITNYNPIELHKHHNKKKHEYCISSTFLEANVIINIPKPKSHRINGVTIGMKNFVGINTRKEYLPHHRLGDVKHGGDETIHKSIFLYIADYFLDKKNVRMSNNKTFLSKIDYTLYRVFRGIGIVLNKDKETAGFWYGNDTIWRTIADINYIVKYADKKGKIKKEIQRKTLNIADMIVVGEGEGPLRPKPKHTGTIVVSKDICEFDMTIATIMGFDVRKIKLYEYLINENLIDYNNIIINSNLKVWNNKTLKSFKFKDSLMIEPTEGYRNHIELE